MTLPNPPYQSPENPPTQAMPSMPTQPLPMAAPPKPGWPGGAKVTAVVLAITTLAAAAAGVVLSSSAKGDADDAKKEVATLRADLADTQDELDGVQQDLEAAEKSEAAVKAELATAAQDRDQAQADLATAQADRDQAQSDLAALQGLFPYGADDLALTPIAGTYNLTLFGTPVCEGYADNASACDAVNLPSSIEIAGNATSGYSVTSGEYFAGEPLFVDGYSYKAKGALSDAVSDQCDGAPSRTRFTLTVRVVEAALVDGATKASQLIVDLTIAADAAGGCTATSRTVSYDAVPA